MDEKNTEYLLNKGYNNNNNNGVEGFSLTGFRWMITCKEGREVVRLGYGTEKNQS